MPDYLHGRLTKPVTLGKNAWYPIEWDKAPAGADYFNLGSPGITVVGPYSATVSVVVTDRKGGNVQIQFLEFQDGEPVETNPIDVVGPFDHVRSSTTGSVANDKGRVLRARVRATDGGKLTDADIVVLAFRPK